MEIEGNNESKTLLTPGSTLIFGRNQCFNSTNKTVSRRHISFRLATKHQDKVRFEVIGKNPIWKHGKRTGKVEIFRRKEKGEMENGDMFCVSAQSPIWFTLKKAQDNSETEFMGLDKYLTQSLENTNLMEGVQDSDFQSVDFSNIDPIKEFSLVVMGHEFDGYGKKINLDARKFDWFIEEPEEGESDDDGHKRKGKRSGKRKKKNGDERDDEEWAGESEEDKELLAKSRKVVKPAYSTRSKDHSAKSKVSRKNGTKLSGRKKLRQAEEDDVGVKDETEDENDETLGGFIVDDVSDEEEDIDEEKDEEEFEKDELEE
ncbi:hypothetical protein LIER_14499 [Lithospermum erythrorhizon]|uniref:Uncharacterized protein n=1 Tax=Lithospermum erythrorhizon TaxID=34254 RepID=A0AAV3Q0Y6_LITER